MGVGDGGGGGGKRRNNKLTCELSCVAAATTVHQCVSGWFYEQLNVSFDR